MKACLLPLLMAVACLAQPGGSATTVAPTFSNLAYAGSNNARQMLDLWVPGGDGPFPLVCFIHGGAFRAGSKANPPAFPERLMPRGFAFCSIGYRLSGEAIWPAQIQDVKAAIRFLRANSARYKLDPNRFGVIGVSAGGHLAAMLGTSGDVTLWDSATMPNAGVSSRVQAVVNQFGPMDFGQMDTQQMPSCQPGATNSASSPESQLLGCTVGTCADKVKEASPITYVSASTPPFLITHGSNDCNISHEQSRLLAQAIAKAGGRAILRVLPGAGHGTAEFNTPNYLSLVDSFFVRTLQTDKVSAVDAAEFQFAVVAPGQLVSLFGTNFVTANNVASIQPWPTVMDGLSISVRDAQGATRNAGLVFTSPGQVNAQLPAALAAGEATLTLTRGGTPLLEDKLQVVSAAPALFAQMVDGLLRPLGEMVWTDAAGVQQRAPIGTLRFSQTPGDITLVLYGTGLNAARATATARVSDVAVTVSYAGAQGQFAGLDQYNIVVPRSLAGRGDVMLSLSVGGMPATAVRLTVE